jgi:hypothetical protein
LNYRWPILLAFAISPMLLPGAAINALPGMPPVVDPNDIYSETHAGKLSPTVRSFSELIYAFLRLEDALGFERSGR